MVLSWLTPNFRNYLVQLCINTYLGHNIITICYCSRPDLLYLLLVIWSSYGAALVQLTISRSLTWHFKTNVCENCDLNALVKRPPWLYNNNIISGIVLAIRVEWINFYHNPFVHLFCNALLAHQHILTRDIAWPPTAVGIDRFGLNYLYIIVLNAGNAFIGLWWAPDQGRLV